MFGASESSCTEVRTFASCLQYAYIHTSYITCMYTACGHRATTTNLIFYEVVYDN